MGSYIRNKIPGEPIPLSKYEPRVTMLFSFNATNGRTHRRKLSFSSLSAPTPASAARSAKWHPRNLFRSQSFGSFRVTPEVVTLGLFLKSYKTWHPSARRRRTGVFDTMHYRASVKTTN